MNTIPLSGDRPATEKKHSPWPIFIISALAFLLPVFLIPIGATPVQFTKVILAVFAVVVLLVFFAFSTIRSKTFSIPISLPLISLLILPGAYLLSALLSSYPQLSLWGYQLEADTFGFILLSCFLTIATLVTAVNARNVFSVLVWLFAGGCVVVLFQLIQLFLGGFLPLAIFSAPVINLIGSWNSFALFVGLIAALGLIAIESLPLSVLHTWLMRGVLLVSVFLLVVANFNLAWILTGAVSFAVFVHSLIRPPEADHKENRIRGITSGIVLVVSVFFIFAGGTISLWLQNGFGIQTLDVRPTVQGTVAIGADVYGKNPVFGTGPNTFGSQWLLSRPEGIVDTPFWDVAFPAGFASIPSAFATGGVLVSAAWLFLLAAFLLTLGKALLSPGKDQRSYLLITVSATGSLYLLVAHLLYVPDQVLTLLMFFMLGLFLASIRNTPPSRELSVSFSENPRAGFLSILVVLALSLGGLLFLYGAGSLYASTLMQQTAVQRSNTGDFDGSRAAIVTAIQLSEQDRYYRTLAAIELARLNVIASAEDLSATERQNQFREVLASAINASTRAAELDRGNYYNWLSRATVYASIVPLQIEGAYDSALAMLEEARLRNPQTPEIDFRIAQIRAANDDANGARESAALALEKKPDYTAAILLLAELSLAEGDLDDAIESVEAATVLEPQNSQLLYQLGLLQLQDKRNEAARDSFMAALAVNPEYANAAFFLGQAQFLLGDTEAALETLKSLRAQNPDNETLENAIDALERGENPFTEDVGTPTE